MTVGIVGMGLIGGSIGLALREPSRRILAFDPSPEHLRLAKIRGCLDESVSLEEAAQAEVVFVATPPNVVASTVLKLLEAKGAETVVTDCASVKGEILMQLRNAGAELKQFVGGHPMAGHEKSGPQFASAWLFRNARWILTPAKGTTSQAVKAVEKVIKLMGAIPMRMDPATHDRHVALLSHVPHALAASLVILGEELDSTEAGAGSWRDLTRVGGVDPALWTQIMMGNRIELAKVVEDFEGLLSSLRDALERNDESAVKAFLEHAKLAKGKHDS